MKILLLSTYELGRQPIHLASPLAALAAAGHQAKGVDLAVEELDQALVAWADAAAISVPMHTATRLAIGLVEDLKRLRPDLPVALYGLYAGVAEDSGADALFAGEYEPALMAWVHTLASGGATPTVVTFTGRSQFAVPRRDGLAALDQYARLEHGGETRLAAAVEASHGCRHRCRHCPIPPLYDGRMRIVPKNVVLADIDQLVA
ncbi:MAG TPA: radical SAM protein, partial [Acidimicrobiia bacterium]|nr:radical SAM protein [Acidimicrobiia bacterium]